MSTYSELVIADGAVGCWMLGESSGTSAADATGNGNTGTYVGSPTLGVAGMLLDDASTAATFTAASSQYVTLPDLSAFELGDCTYEGWVKTTTTGTIKVLVMEGETADNLNHDAMLRVGTTNTAAALCRNDAAASFQVTGTTTLTDGVAHYLSSVKSGTTLSLNVDGNPEGTPITISGTFTHTASSLGVQRRLTPSNFMNGTMQGQAIYKLALTPQQQLNHFRAGRAQFQGSAHDASSSSSSGVAVGSLAWSHTVASHGGRGMVVGVSIANTLSQTVTGVTFGAANLTFFGALNNGTTERVELWGMSSPVVSTDTVTVTFSAAAVAVAGSTSLYNVAPNPFSVVTTASGTGTAASVSSPGGRFYDLVHDVIASAAVSLTVGAGQRQRWNVGVAGVAGAGSTAPGTTASLAWTNNTSVTWAQAAVNVKALRAGNAIGLLGVG